MLKCLHIGQNFPQQLLYDFVKTSIFLELMGHKISTENRTVGFPEGMKEGSKWIPILFPHSWGLGGSCTVLTWTAPILASLVSSPFPAPWTLNRCTISPQVLHCTLHRFSATTIYLLSGTCSVFISPSAPQLLHCTLHRFSATMILAPHSEDAPFAKKLWCWYFYSFLEEISAFKLGLVPFIRTKQGHPRWWRCLQIGWCFWSQWWWWWGDDVYDVRRRWWCRWWWWWWWRWGWGDDVDEVDDDDDDDGGGEAMMFMMCGAGGDNRRQWKAPQEASTRTWQSSAWAQFYCLPLIFFSVVLL